MVRPRQPPPAYEQPIADPATIASFSPLRIIVPFVIVLFVVFGIVFLLTRSPGQPSPNQNQSQTGLAADPNSQPVQFASPPTGESERGIQSKPVASPFGGTITETASPNPNAASKSTPVLPTAINGKFGANDNSSDRGNRNANQPRESPVPKPSAVKVETPVPKPSPKPAATPIN